MKEDTRVLLALLPVWDPLIPPLGIACLKSFIRGHGYNVETVDVNVDEGFRAVYDDYFQCLQTLVRPEKRRHLYNIGHEVLKNHMMAYINHEDEAEYRELVKILVDRTFFTPIEDCGVERLNRVIGDFYSRLETYLLHLLETKKPTVLGLSVYSGTLAPSLFAFRLAKQKYPHIKTVMGGAVFSGELAADSPEFDYFLEKTPYIDRIIVGEGENLFLKLLQGQLPESQRVFTLKDLDGDILALSSAVLPDFSDFDLGLYWQLASYTSRSCPFQCTFCVETEYWGKYRKKEGKQIAGELMELYERYGSRLFLMCDSLLNPVITPLAEACIEMEASLYWGGYLRVDPRACNIENTLLWRRGGFYRARLGIESGSPRILEMMHKKIDMEEVKTTVSSLAYAGIKTTAMFVIGYPGETEEDFQKTLDLVEELRDDIYEADCNPFWYFLRGQVNSDVWQGKNRGKLLYPGDARDMLLVQTWILDGEPSREETYRRVNRFIEHCKKLRIPDPYTLVETVEADARWKRLHKNAVPALVDLKDGGGRRVAVESRPVKELTRAVDKPGDEGDWNF